MAAARLSFGGFRPRVRGVSTCQQQRAVPAVSPSSWHLTVAVAVACRLRPQPRSRPCWLILGGAAGLAFARRKISCQAVEAEFCCRVCGEKFPSNNQLHKHLRCEHPTLHLDMTCAKCKASPLEGSCFVNKENLNYVLCQHCHDHLDGTMSREFEERSCPKHKLGYTQAPRQRSKEWAVATMRV